jgi:hypothetical protein
MFVARILTTRTSCVPTSSNTHFFLATKLGFACYWYHPYRRLTLAWHSLPCPYYFILYPQESVTSSAMMVSYNLNEGWKTQRNVVSDLVLLRHFVSSQSVSIFRVTVTDVSATRVCAAFSPVMCTVLGDVLQRCHRRVTPEHQGSRWRSGK